MTRTTKEAEAIMLRLRPIDLTDLRDDFWENVIRTPTCWIWKRSRHNQEYGSFRFEGVRLGAHRVSWLLTYGEIPNGHGVLHRCDTPACVNPSDLFTGTQADNMADLMQKNRSGQHWSEQKKALVVSSFMQIARLRLPQTERLKRNSAVQRYLENKRGWLHEADYAILGQIIRGEYEP